MAEQSKDILIEPGPALLLAVERAASILKELGLEGQTMPKVREEITVRVFGLDSKEPELIKKLKQRVPGFKGIVDSEK